MKIRLAGIVLGLSLVVACGGPSLPSPHPDSFSPLDDNVVLFWDRQTTETAELLNEIADDFNAQHDGLPIKIVQSGNYGDIYRKVVAGIQAGALPGLAVAYETMIPGYVNAGALTALDDFVADPKVGLSEEELADFFPSALETNSFEELGGKMYSFPYTKSVLMLFYNDRVLKSAGIEAPPRTWTDFLDQCRKIKRSTGNTPLAVDVDASTVDGIIFSMGGEVVSGRTTLYDSPESIAAFELYETLKREELLYQITPRTFDDETSFGQDKIAFSFRTSASRPHFSMVMDYDDTTWGMSAIPQANPDDPRTVVYGGNICVFQTTPEQRETAWAFIKYFTSTETSVRWALGTGYLPIRKSAASNADIQAYWKETPYNRASFDSLAFARPEPNLKGWQQVRGLIEKALTSVITGLATGEEAARTLKQEADAALADQ